VDLRALGKNTSWIAAALGVNTVLLLVESIVAARVLGTSAFGAYVLIRAFPEAVQMFLDCRTRETIIRFLGEFVATGDNEAGGAVVRLVWVVDAIVGCLAFLLVFALAPVAATIVVHDTASAGLIRLYAVGMFASTLDSAWGSVARVLDRFRLSAVVGTVGSLLRFTLVTSAILLGYGVGGAIAGRVIAEVVYAAIAVAVALGLLRRGIGFRIFEGFKAVRRRRVEVFKFLLYTNISGTLKMSSDKLAVLLVGALGGARVAALFKVASQMGTAPLLLSDPFQGVVFPMLSKAVARREWDSAKQGMKQLTLIGVSVVLPTAAILSVTMPQLVALLFGRGYESASAAAVVVLWGVAPAIVIFWLRPLLLAMGEARLTMYIGAAASLAQVAATAALMPAFGLIGAAGALLAMYWLQAGLQLGMLSRVRDRMTSRGVVAS
jgi:O-antigen/teichoic acid export membrane protein